METVIGLALGVISSLFVWWVLTHKITSEIEFSQKISKVVNKKETSLYRYRIKFENTGRRGIVDIKLVARLRIKGLEPDFKNNLENFDIPLGYNSIPILFPETDKWQKLTNFLFRSQITRKKIWPIVTLHIQNIDSKYLARLPDEIVSKINSKEISLEDFLKLGKSAYIQLVVFGNDMVSGTRKVFCSKDYSLVDVVPGKFKPRSLEIFEGQKLIKTGPSYN